MTKTSARAPQTTKIEVEILDENEAAALLALPIYAVRDHSCRGTLPGGVWREGRDYQVSVEQATRLRQLLAGVTPPQVFARECDLEARAADERERPVREAIAAADARVAAERDRERKEGEARAAARIAREKKRNEQYAAISGVRQS
jgi:hypothetical protein